MGVADAEPFGLVCGDDVGVAEPEACGDMLAQLGLAVGVAVLAGVAVLVGVAVLLGVGLGELLDGVGLGEVPEAVALGLDDAVLDGLALAELVGDAELVGLLPVQDGDGEVSSALGLVLAEVPVRPAPAALVVRPECPGPGGITTGGVPVPPAVAPPASELPPPLPDGWPVRTVELSWTIASRNGGTAAATPAAKTAQAMASAGRINTAISQEGRPVRRRHCGSLRTTPPSSAVPAVLPDMDVKGAPELIRCLIRSRPSGPGST